MLVSLIGYRGTGKTTVGSLLADRVGWQCIDSDVQIEHDMGMSIARIFELEGEDGFRSREQAVIEKLTRMYKVILALGGGAILRETNRRQIKAAGPVVWLTGSPEELHRRLSSDPVSSSQRPDLTVKGGIEEIKEVLEQRMPLYQECADVVIDSDGKLPRQLVDEIVAALDLPERARSEEEQ